MRKTRLINPDLPNGAHNAEKNVRRYFNLLCQRHLLFMAWMLILISACSPPVWQKADLAERRGELAEAVEIMEAHLQIFPRDARAWYRLGELQARLALWEDMNRSYDRCDSLDHRWRADIQTSREYHWRKNINKGLLAMEAKDWALCQDYFRQATEIMPKDGLAFRLLAETALAQNQTDEAVEYLNEAIDRDSSDTRAHRILMAQAFRDRDFSTSLLQSQWVLFAFPQDPEALRYQAYALDRLGQDQDADSAYRLLLQHSHEAEDYRSFAALNYRMGDYEEAIVMSQAAIEAGGDPIANLRAIAQVYLTTQNFPQLAETAREILKIEPDNVAALQLLQLAQVAMGNYNKAEKIHLKIEALKTEKP